jgi:hypothetical protein
MDKLPAAALETARGTIDVQSELTVSHIQARKLSRRGANTLGVITNRLRGSIRRTDAVISGQSVTGAIGSNVRYLGPHEFGFEGDVKVKAHRAKNAATDILLIAGGRQIRRWELIGSGATRARQIASGTAMVRAHTRHMKIPARAPLRRGIEERAPATGKALGDAILRVFP